MESRFGGKNKIWIVFLCLAVLLFVGSVWIYRTYGVLSLAMANESFRGGLRNKRILFVKYVVLPPVVIFAVSLLVDRVLKASARRIMTYFMGALAVVSFCTSMACLDVGSYLKRQHRMNQKQWYDEDDLIVHALGSIDGMQYTNSREALENSYQNGNRLFECDMIMTADGKLVAGHDWEFWNQNVDVDGLSEEQQETYVPTLDVFMNHKFLGKYTPLSFGEILLFLKEHPDAYLITDTKYVEPDDVKKEFQELVNVVRENDCEEVTDRIVVQLYHGYMHDIIEQIYSFPNYIFTLYAEGYRGEEDKMKEYAEFCVRFDVDVITMNAQYYHDGLLDICNEYGIHLFVHTVNDQDEIDAFHEKGIGVYTDNVER